MELIRDFNGLNKEDAAIAGGKGASLGEMTQAGIPVPPGFVILSQAFEEFLSATDLTQEIDAILDTVNHQDISSVERASEEIKGLILSRDIPQSIAESILYSYHGLNTTYVAVRSSATAEDSKEHAWAGQLESYLNATEKTLLDDVKRCWASLFTPRAIFYRFEKGLHNTHISVAVVVQEMVNSEISGIAFSVHPVTEDANQLIIEAGYGLGEAIVSGQITPESYVVEKNPRRIIDINVSTQHRALYRLEDGGSEWKEVPELKVSSQVLSEDQVLELSELILRIEKHYGFPCDIEWAFEQGKFSIVQSRPITTLSRRVPKRNTKPYFKINVSRDAALVTFEVWAKSDTQKLNDWIGITTERIILENTQGVITAYEDEKIFTDAEQSLKNLLTDKSWLPRTLQKYRDNIELVTTYSKELIAHPSQKTFEVLFEQLAATQGGLAIVYLVPTIDDIAEEEKQLCLKERKATENFFYDANAVLESGILLLYPEYKEYVSVLSIQEILSGNIPEKSVLDERKKHFIYYDGMFRPQSSIRDIEKELDIDIEQKEKVEFQNEIKGTVAFAGAAKGSVVVVLRRSDLLKVKTGDVMVCSMTTPDFLPAMQKAAAFVTDEGGVTCHAAIVAREMQKPCIIGTKFATEVLKDGDLVEVDADHGVVRILEKKQSRVLTNLFSREKSLYYFDLWNQCDRDGPKRFFGKGLDTVLFIILPKGKKGSVWYDPDEMQEIKEDAIVGLAKNEVLQQVRNELHEAWEFLQPYALGKEICDVDELKEYQKYLLQYWSAMNSGVWEALGDPRVSEDVRRAFVEVREQTERYSERWSVLPTEYFSKQHPNFAPIAHVVTFAEMVALIEGNVSDEEMAEIHARTNGCFMVNSAVYSDIAQLDNILSELHLVRDVGAGTSSEEIYGTVAFPGRIQGVVRIIDGKKDLAKIQEGEILVTQMTNPEYVPVMKLSGAIVTDEGGALCHAAIASRELKIPCIIGTKFATEVLKDGDLVEVDADHGVVRVITANSS